VPHAGLDAGRLRCLDAATGDLLWEALFSGSPSWNRQLPPIVYKNLVFYMFSTGKYGPEIPHRDKVEWFFGHQQEAGLPPLRPPLPHGHGLGQIGQTAHACAAFSEGFDLSRRLAPASNFQRRRGAAVLPLARLSQPASESGSKPADQGRLPSENNQHEGQP
jgi:hypothetical protein